MGRNYAYHRKTNRYAYLFMPYNLKQYFLVNLLLQFVTGSMCGAHILHARTAVMEFLKILPPDSYFNIASFGSGHTMLAER